MLGNVKELRVSVLERDEIGMLGFSDRKGAPVNVNNFVYLGVKGRDANGNEDWVEAKWSAEKGDIVLITPRTSSTVRVVALKPADEEITITAEFEGLRDRAIIQRIARRSDLFSNSGALREQPLARR